MRSLLGGLAAAALIAAGCSSAPSSAGSSPSPTSPPATSSPESTATPTPTRPPTPQPTKTPFIWQLLANGGEQFIQVTGAPMGSTCTAMALLANGRDITAQTVKPMPVTNTAQGVSWSATSAQPLVVVPSPAPSPATATWSVTCTNAAYNPPSATTTKAFQIA